jgi:hypothetical protein
MFYFGISKYLNFLRESFDRKFEFKYPKQCDVIITMQSSLRKRRKSILKVKVPLWRDFHVHGAMGGPYWPILACGTSVQAITQYFEEFKINIPTCIQTKLST